MLALYDQLLVPLAAAAPSYLDEAVWMLAIGAAVAYIGSRLGLVPIVGFLLAGVVIGPHGLGLVQDRELVDGAAELGVILLLFTIGIELRLDKLIAIRGLIFGGGGLQVGLATLITAGLAMLVGVPLPTAIFTGFLVALSSTAIVLKMLADRGETNAPHGQIALGFLIFQDLAILGMVMLVPVLSGEMASPLDIGVALGKALLLVVLVLGVARRGMPWLLEKVQRACSPEVFLLSVIAICLGTAWLSSLAGVSVSLGAFLAGLMVSESRFGQHAFSEILPLQILFSAGFFLSVGMLLDLRFALTHWAMILLVIVGVLVIKILTSGVAALALGRSPAVAAASALMLAQVGEFSFVLERAGRDLGLFPAGHADLGPQVFVAASVVLMVATPALASLGQRVAQRLERDGDAPTGVGDDTHDAHAHGFDDLDDHVILVGWADAARGLAKAFSDAGIPFGITTLSPAGAHEAEALGYNVLRGDATRRHILDLAGISRARILVVADDGASMTHRVVAVARGLRDDLKIVARTRFSTDVAEIVHAGADEVATDEVEGVLGVCCPVLLDYGQSPEAVREHAMAVRAAVREATTDDDDPPASRGSREVDYVDPEATLEVTPADGTSCSHVDRLRPVRPGTRGCEDCLRTGGTWVHLRVCMTCGHVGCCDSSPGRHARAHAEASGHPIIRSLEPGESWAWCFEDEVEV
ncbi:MAG: cation:proton antiporter [Acidobacteriota bacterium]